MNGIRFSRRVGEQVPDATYAGSLYRYRRAVSIIDRLGYFLGIALLAGALSLPWWTK